ncbi:hypothetical protein C1H46_001999 [Malus baccata]|uniref:HAUS augmin-like complex subunit 3 N-terminal domain-containing protein n=1 Tax=Malus baccata TaxID=106549 RepID=A0A540NMT3_MALBA|nr:hypothetical protein C1H46_001999 [Malus baccata]
MAYAKGYALVCLRDPRLKDSAAHSSDAIPQDLIGFFMSIKLRQAGEDLDFAYDSISAFASRPDNQEAVFAAEEGLKDIRDATLAYKAEALQLRRPLRHLHSQFDMLTDQASTLIQGRRARVAATSTVNGHLTTIDDSLSARNLQGMASTQTFHAYLIGDSSFIKELNQWFAKQLDTCCFHLGRKFSQYCCNLLFRNPSKLRGRLPALFLDPLH